MGVKLILKILFLFRLFYAKHKYYSDMGHCFSKVVMVSKKSKKDIYMFVLHFSLLGKTDMELGKKVGCYF